MSESAAACIGCGAVVPAWHGPSHAYIGASPGCWKVYGDVLAREYGEFRNPSWHRLTVDAYAAQHPGVESRRSVQSVAVHLIALHLVLERGEDPARVTRRIAALVRDAARFRWLAPPSFEGRLTVLEVACARGEREHERAVRRWAESVWEAWAEHHPAVREWGAG